MKENGSRGFKLLSFWDVSDVKIFTGSYFVGSDIDVPRIGSGLSSCF